MFRNRIGVWACACVMIASVFRANAAELPWVDRLIVFAADVSNSVSEDERRMQREGHAAAIQDGEVLAAIQKGMHGRIGVVYIEWCSADKQLVVADWMVVRDSVSATRFANNILNGPELTSGLRNTATYDAIMFSVDLLRRAPYQSHAKMIDVSSDGNAANGLDVRIAREYAVENGIVINVLAILDSDPNPDRLAELHTKPPEGLVRYFEVNVIGGPNAFVMSANDNDSYVKAMKRKLYREVFAMQ